MKMHKYLWAIRNHRLGTGLVLALLLLGYRGICKPQSSSPETKTEAEVYLEQALSLMQDNYVYRSSVDWQSIRREAFEQAAGAEKPIDTYEAIRSVLRKLGDRHCRFQLTKELAEAEAARRAEKHLPPIKETPRVESPFRGRTQFESRLLKVSSHGYSVLVIPMFTGPDTSRFATTIQKGISDLATQHPCGWIVDLRGNRGGNMWPMLAGLGPLLGIGVVGKFVDHDGKAINEWFYKNGRAWVGTEDGTPRGGLAVAETATVVEDHPPVAVLIDQATGSSGEALAIAFKGRQTTRFFGTKTVGAASSPKAFPLSDGAMIILPEVALADRNGRTYKNGIEPDEQVDYKSLPSGGDSVIDAASDWLAGQALCQVP